EAPVEGEGHPCACLCVRRDRARALKAGLAARVSPDRIGGLAAQQEPRARLPQSVHERAAKPSPRAKDIFSHSLHLNREKAAIGCHEPAPRGNLGAPEYRMRSSR